MTLEVPFRGPLAKYDPPSAKVRASSMSLARQVPGASFSNSGAPEVGPGFWRRPVHFLKNLGPVEIPENEIC